jgi:hypothetical protein
MPARDGTGPLGQGAGTGHGRGGCYIRQVAGRSLSTTVSNRPYHWGGRVWECTVECLFGRRRAHR